MAVVIFPIFTNVFYLLNVLLAFNVGWIYISFAYLAVFITSLFYHICENANACAFDWDMHSWRSLDHITAWYGLAMTAIYGINPELFPTKRYFYQNYKNMLSHYKELLKYNTHTSVIISNHEIKDTHKEKEIIISFYDRLYFGIYGASVNFFLILFLIEIIYLSNNMVDVFPVPQIVICVTIALGVLIPRVILYLEKKDFKRKIKRKHSDFRHRANVEYLKNFLFFGNRFNMFYLILSYIFAGIAIAFFMLHEDKNGIYHGLWHLCGAASGTLYILSIKLA